MSPVQLNEAVADAASMLEPQFMEKALAFEIRLPSEPLVVWADSEKLQQILLNLLSNAIKFTPPEGQIMFEVTEHCADGDGPELVPLTYVRISDTGLGIPEEKLSSIFEPFVQVDGSLTRTVGGVGLGLAISRDLARGMGGDIYVRSIMGKGSTFTLTLRAWSHSLHN
jgi:signal transduction histidine kinase